MTTLEIVEQGIILRATVGSTVHGLHHGGQDDRDEMAVFIEPPEYLLGLARARGIRGGLYGFEHYVQRTQPEGVRSSASASRCSTVSISAIVSAKVRSPVRIAMTRDRSGSGIGSVRKPVSRAQVPGSRVARRASRTWCRTRAPLRVLDG